VTAVVVSWQAVLNLRKYFSGPGYPSLLFCLFLAAEIVVNPLGNFPLNDDWSYSKTTVLFHLSGFMDIGTWGAMTLVTHVLWGTLFVKIFGYSHVVVRMSTLVSALIGVFTLYRLTVNITHKRLTAFIASLTLLFSPLSFVLGNTYMTDVNFQTLFILFMYFAHRYFNSGNKWHLPVLAVLSFMLVFLRQFGFVAPLGLLIGSLFMRRGRLFALSVQVVSIGAIYFAFAAYERYLRRHLPDWAGFRFSGSLDVTDPGFHKQFYHNVASRSLNVITQVFVYAAPFCVFFLRPLIATVTRRQLVAVLTATVVLVACLSVPATFPFGNIFANMVLGPETFYQNWMFGDVHNRFSEFNYFSFVLKTILSAVTIMFILLTYVTRSWRFSRPSAFAVTMTVAMLAYAGLVFVSPVWFDRYLMPLSVAAFVPLSFASRQTNAVFRWETVLVQLVFVYISVAGTRDYMLWNAKRWEAYGELRRSGVEVKRLNGGFEVNNWYDGIYGWWGEFESLDSVNYLIQFRPEPGFRRFRTYPFVRFFPPRRDTVSVFERVVPFGRIDSTVVESKSLTPDAK
jgi:hypothetical protein